MDAIEAEMQRLTSQDRTDWNSALTRGWLPMAPTGSATWNSAWSNLRAATSANWGRPPRLGGDVTSVRFNPDRLHNSGPATTGGDELAVGEQADFDPARSAALDEVRLSGGDCRSVRGLQPGLPRQPAWPPSAHLLPWAGAWKALAIVTRCGPRLPGKLLPGNPAKPGGTRGAVCWNLGSALGQAWPDRMKPA